MTSSRTDYAQPNSNLQQDDPFFEKESDIVVSDEFVQSQQKAKPAKPYKRKRYGWAFMVASTMMGVGITATTGLPFGVLGGIGFGFLFFVDPIHDRVVDILGGQSYREEQKMLEEQQNQQNQKYLP